MSKTNSMTAGTVAQAAQVNQNFDELGRLNDAQATADQGTFTAETDLTGLSVAVTISAAFATANRKIKITGHCAISSSVASDAANFRIKEGATILQDIEQTLPTTATRRLQFDAVAIIQPTAGVHTYKLSALRAAGTGNLTMKAAATAPAFIIVEAI